MWTIKRDGVYEDTPANAAFRCAVVMVSFDVDWSELCTSNGSTIVEGAVGARV